MKSSDSRTRPSVRSLAQAALMAAVISVCAWIQIPFGQINFTMQTFGVFVSLGLLGGRLGTVSVVVYLLLGAVGAPVFTNFSGGIAKLAGPTGGYLIGFVFAGLTYWCVTRLFGEGRSASVLGMIFGNLVCYAFGTVWFMTTASRQSGLAAALSLCVLPYILPDLLKIALACAVAVALRDRLRAARIL